MNLHKILVAGLLSLSLSACGGGGGGDGDVASDTSKAFTVSVAQLGIRVSINGNELNVDSSVLTRSDLSFASSNHRSSAKIALAPLSTI